MLLLNISSLGVASRTATSPNTLRRSATRPSSCLPQIWTGFHWLDTCDIVSEAAAQKAATAKTSAVARVEAAIDVGPPSQRRRVARSVLIAALLASHGPGADVASNVALSAGGAKGREIRRG
jgi:hypothetical protein